MTRPAAACLFVAALLVGLAGIPGAPSDGGAASAVIERPVTSDAWRPAGDARECKPRGPLAVHLSSRGSGRRVELSWSLEPVLDLADVSFQLALPPGAVIVDGVTEGLADATRGVVTHGRATVELPSSFPAGDVSLAATARLGADGDAWFTVERGLPELGSPPVVGTRRDLPASDGRSPVAVRALPSLHRPGR